MLINCILVMNFTYILSSYIWHLFVNHSILGIDLDFLMGLLEILIILQLRTTILHFVPSLLLVEVKIDIRVVMIFLEYLLKGLRRWKNALEWETSATERFDQEVEVRSEALHFHRIKLAAEVGRAHRLTGPRNPRYLSR